MKRIFILPPKVTFKIPGMVHFLKAHKLNIKLKRSQILFDTGSFLFKSCFKCYIWPTNYVSNPLSSLSVIFRMNE